MDWLHDTVKRCFGRNCKKYDDDDYDDYYEKADKLRAARTNWVNWGAQPKPSKKKRLRSKTPPRMTPTYLASNKQKEKEQKVYDKEKADNDKSNQQTYAWWARKAEDEAEAEEEEERREKAESRKKKEKVHDAKWRKHKHARDAANRRAHRRPHIDEEKAKWRKPKHERDAANRRAHIEENTPSPSPKGGADWSLDVRNKLLDPYKVLDIDYEATKKQIRDAWIMKSKIWHPDRGICSKQGHACTPEQITYAEEMMKQINNAYEKLT